MKKSEAAWSTGNYPTTLPENGEELSGLDQETGEKLKALRQEAEKRNQIGVNSGRKQQKKQRVKEGQRKKDPNESSKGNSGDPKKDRCNNDERETRDNNRKCEPARNPPSVPIMVACGLVNLGSTCYINSVLQCLWLVATRTGLLQSYSMQLSRSTMGAVEKEFWQMMNRMTSLPEVSAFSLRNFKSILAQLHGQFRSNQQQDAHEFLITVLDTVKSLSTKTGGVLLSVLECSFCGHQSPTSEKFRCLSLDIPTSLLPDPDACFKETWKSEFLSEARCPGCGSIGVSKSTQITSMPNVLVVQLKRFRQSVRGYVKNQATVTVPHRFCIHQQAYDVIGVVNHVGGDLNAGHYTADILLDRWKHCNDRKVRNIERAQNSKEAYLLFCMKR